jgi:hypothetical protein
MHQYVPVGCRVQFCGPTLDPSCQHYHPAAAAAAAVVSDRRTKRWEVRRPHQHGGGGGSIAACRRHIHSGGSARTAPQEHLQYLIFARHALSFSPGSWLLSQHLQSFLFLSLAGLLLAQPQPPNMPSPLPPIHPPCPSPPRPTSGTARSRCTWVGFMASSRPPRRMT